MNRQMGFFLLIIFMLYNFSMLFYVITFTPDIDLLGLIMFGIIDLLLYYFLPERNDLIKEEVK